MTASRSVRFHEYTLGWETGNEGIQNRKRVCLPTPAQRGERAFQETGILSGWKRTGLFSFPLVSCFEPGGVAL